MNSCYYCLALVNRAPKDTSKAHVCDTCSARFAERKSRGQHPITGEPMSAPEKPVFGDPAWIRRAIKPEPLSREEKQEMEGCGA